MALLAPEGTTGGAPPSIDPVGFTVLRLVSGAVFLAPVLWLRSSARPAESRASVRGSLAGAAAMLIYAFPFSASYVTLPAGIGALVLFGVVQIVMLGTAKLRGERLGPLRAAGLLAAIVGVFVLVGPSASAGAEAVDPVGAALMIAAGVGWAAYTLLGRGGAVPPTELTAMNFAVAAPLAAAAGATALLAGKLQWTPRGIVLSILSGAITSGAGYAIWYAALRGHSRTSAAAVQLTVPLIAAAGGVALLDEALDSRFAISAVLVLGGIGLTLAPRKPDRL